jgi:gamma-glutamylcysteine synthetase
MSNATARYDIVRNFLPRVDVSSVDILTKIAMIKFIEKVVAKK